jgi:hypothetical protein
MTIQTQTKRHFENFLSAYFDYARDGFCPDEFHRWIGLSVLAGAVQRKISLRDGKIFHVPNIYVMLVSHPAVGKSTAIERGTELLEEMRKQYAHDFRIIPNQATEPALIDLMKIVERYPIDGGRLLLPHSSGYFYASEASASALQNTCGDFVAAMTAFYDCPKYFRKKLKGEQHSVEIENACMNMLAGSTFEYLRNLVNETSVMGGFASRNIYVVSKERKVREKKWGVDIAKDEETKQKLVQDLAHINTLAGPMQPTTEWIRCVEKWFPQFDQYLKDLNSPRLESLLGRKGTNLIKVCMLLSIAESDCLILTQKHFEEAKEIIDRVTEDVPDVLASAIMANTESQNGLNHFILHTIKRNGGRILMSALRKAIVNNGNDPTKFESTLTFMREAQEIKTHNEGSLIYVELLPNAKA